MQRIVPHLWFDKEAPEAADFYASAFEGSRVKAITTIRGTPSGDSDIVVAEIWGVEFTMISAGPYFKKNPSISFIVHCKDEGEVDHLWELLSPKGTVRMELGAYPFSEKYGWVEDKFGVNWQLMLSKKVPKQRIVPTLMFTNNNAGNAEPAAKFYTEVFKSAKLQEPMRYPAGGFDKEGTIAHMGVNLDGTDIAVMDSAAPHEFTFNEGVSLMVKCKDQKEIDYFWEKMSAVPAAEQCGWIKDKFGVSWQITPASFDENLAKYDEAKKQRVVDAMLQMKKLDIKALEDAAKGK